MADDEAQLEQLHRLNTLADALETVSDALHDDDAFVPATDGLSLLDTKNGLLLSYLQSLVFLLLVQLRHLQVDVEDKSVADGVAGMSSEVQQKLNELRIYLDRGVRPIESRLKYQIDSARDKQAAASKERSLRSNNDHSGVYKAPRMNPTAMPDPDKRERERTNEPRKRKSQLLNEYIDEELSSAPRAQPSIGKKERREARRKGLLNNRDVFGGEDWTGLGGLGDRVSKSVSLGGRGERDSVLKRREKRRATEDLPRGEGTSNNNSGGIGDSFEKRRRILEARAERKAMKRR
ncbi:hypothetical protein DV735_g3611, partial [Chaetothyriales sp. CBS 134920]